LYYKLLLSTYRYRIVRLRVVRRYIMTTTLCIYGQTSRAEICYVRKFRTSHARKNISKNVEKLKLYAQRQHEWSVGGRLIEQHYSRKPKYYLICKIKHDRHYTSCRTHDGQLTGVRYTNRRASGKPVSWSRSPVSMWCACLRTRAQRSPVISPLLYHNSGICGGV